MVRASSYIRCPDEEEVGISIKDIENGFVIEISRDGKMISDPDEIIDEDDNLIYMPPGISNTFGELYKIGKMAKRLDVSLSIHTPYYMDLGTNNELTYECLDNIRHAALIMNALDGNIVVTSLGLYNRKLSKEEINENIYRNVSMLTNWWHENKIKPRLGIEITGQQDVFGSLDQILDLCDVDINITPVINFSHHHSRTNGSLLETSDFMDIMSQVEPYSNGQIHTAFSGVDYINGNERRLTPIKKGDLKFEPLAEALINTKTNVTIISTSPLLEHDAMYMRIIHERVLNKRVSKSLKEKKRAEVGR